VSEKVFIESPSFPVDVVNKASASEKRGGGRPEYWEMVFWWTRKPLAGARAVILASLLGETDARTFLRWLYPSIRFLDEDEKCKKKSTSKKGKEAGICFEETPHRSNPALPPEVGERLRGVKLLDPFAGFGSIPLEAVRLGVGEVVAVELLPTAYVFLKAVLEYPKAYGGRVVRVSGGELKRLELEGVARKFSKARTIRDNREYEVPALIYDVARWGRWVAERLREDPDIRELYDEGVAVHIGTWEVRCPICGRYTPLVGNWWLAKVRGRRYAYMVPRVEGNDLAVEVVKGESRGAPEPNVRGRPEHARCLLCGSAITFIDPETGRVYASEEEAKEAEVKGRLVFYPKHALRNWNERLERYLEGALKPEDLRNAPARPRILAKVKIIGGDLKFEPATQEDGEKLWRALEKLKAMWGDPDIPTEPIPPYASRYLFPILYGFDKWYKLFNPRQLLTLVKLAKLIREVGKKVEEEKLKEGWSKEEAHRYAEAVTTYLAIVLCKHADWNSTTSGWQLSYLIAAHTLAMRGIAMVWNWGEYNPLSDYRGTWKAMTSNIIDGLSYLVSAVSSSPSRVRVLLDDATSLSKLGGEKFDLIVTDPPYRDDVPYAELSDLYYVWLKRALSDDGLKPRFHGEALAYNTQWEALSASEVSYDEGRAKFFGLGGEEHYRRLMASAFRRVASLLKDGGVLVTYFAHSTPEAWAELVGAGWGEAGLRVTGAWSVVTESEERVTARGKTALESSIVVVWRKRGDSAPRVAEYSDVRARAEGSTSRALSYATASKLKPADVLLAAVVGALSELTSYDRITRFGREMKAEDLVRESYAIATRVIAGALDAVSSPEALLYLACKALYRRYAGSPAREIVLSSQDVIVLSYGLGLGGSNKSRGGGKKKGKGGGRGKSKSGVGYFVETGLLKPVASKGAGVAKQKAFRLLEPLDASINGLRELLGERGVDPVKLTARGRNLNAVDVLHLLEYYAKLGKKEFDAAYGELSGVSPSLVREALEVAKVVAKMEGDPERGLCISLLEKLRW